MSPREIQIVKESWQQVQPLGDGVAELFYDRLFALDPSLRAMFRNDMKVQGRMLTSVIGMAVSKLDFPGALLPALRAMGRRHASYGVEDRHYPIVGAALLDTLAEGLQESFTPEMKAAWAATYKVLADAMKAGAAPEMAEAA